MLNKFLSIKKLITHCSFLFFLSTYFQYKFLEIIGKVNGIEKSKGKKIRGFVVARFDARYGSLRLNAIAEAM